MREDIRISCCDCIEGMDALPHESVDLIIADPPYNLGKDYGNSSDMKTRNQYLDWTEAWLYAADKILKTTGSIYVFMGTELIADVYREMESRFCFNSWIVWHYTQGIGKTRGFSPRHEDILFFTKSHGDFRFYLSAIRQPQKFDREVNNPLGANPGDVWSIPHVHHNKREKEPHPTQKPIAVIDRIIQASSAPGDMVVDPFLGSGTTAVVCQTRKRNFVGCDLNPKYVKQAISRLTKQSSNIG